MASLVARTAHISRSRSSTLARICSNVGGSLSFSVLQYRNYSDVSSSPSAADPLSREFSPALPQTFRDRPIYLMNAHEKSEGFRVYGTLRVETTENSTRTELKEEGNVAKVSRQDIPRQGFPSGKELPTGFACGHSNIHLPTTSITSEAVATLKDRQQEGLCRDSYFFIEILKQCSKQKDLEATRQVHDYIIQSGMQKNPYVATTLLNAYIKCTRLQDAQQVFDGLVSTHRTVITWNVMISAYAKCGHSTEAYQLFLRMKREGFTPDAFTYASILNTSASEGALDWVRDVHSHACKAGLESNLRVANALIHMYAKMGSIDDARVVFDRMERRDVVTWTSMIGGYAERGDGVKAYGLFLQMTREGFIPDSITYASILNSASASPGALEWVREVHTHARKARLHSNLYVGNALLHMYAKSGSVDDARLVFDRMGKRDVITWTSMIGGYAKRGDGVKAYGLFLQMKREACEADAFTYASILNSSASAGALEWVKKVHGHARKAGLDSNLLVGNALIHMYAKSGSIDDARLVFNRMEEQDVVTRTAMISGLAVHGCGNEALNLFQKMITDGVKPDGITFVALLTACCHAGLVDEGRKLFLAMKEEYGVEPTVMHYTCMVDLLGRAGRLEEAKLLIDSMPVEPNAVTWKTLLGACRTHSNVELGEVSAEEVFKLNPNDAPAYVLLANIYAGAGMWEKRTLVRAMMQERGVRKEPGRSWIQIDNRIHEFVAGDTSHPESEAVYNELKKLTLQLKAKGYIPDTKAVLHNVDEEEKELALCSHSEKLAIAYGLLRVPRGKLIRVEKNLRVCSDCHAATKLISEVTGREIIVRDASRFHHFKDGVCSCGDYW